MGYRNDGQFTPALVRAFSFSAGSAGAVCKHVDGRDKPGHDVWGEGAAQGPRGRYLLPTGTCRFICRETTYGELRQC